MLVVIQAVLLSLICAVLYLSGAYVRPIRPQYTTAINSSAYLAYNLATLEDKRQVLGFDMGCAGEDRVRCSVGVSEVSRYPRSREWLEARACTCISAPVRMSPRTQSSHVSTVDIEHHIVDSSMTGRGTLTPQRQYDQPVLCSNCSVNTASLRNLRHTEGLKQTTSSNQHF